MMRNHTFQYLSHHAGKGQRDGIKRLYQVNQNNKIVETYVEWSKIEKELLNYNALYFIQAHYAKAYKDKVHNTLRDNKVRERILKGEIQREDCDNDNMYYFLKLLKQPKGICQNTTCGDITTEQWMKVAKKSKRRSASSIFPDEIMQLINVHYHLTEWQMCLLLFAI